MKKKKPTPVAPQAETFKVKELIIESDFFKKMFNDQKDMFTFGAQKIIEAKLNSADQVKDQTKTFKDILGAVTAVAKGATETSGRVQTKSVEKNIAFLEGAVTKLSNSGELSDEQSEYFNNILKELKTSNKHLLKNEHSLVAVAKNKLKEKIPTMTGLLSSVGMNDPALLFVGKFMEDMITARKKMKDAQKDEQQELLASYRENKIKEQLLTGGQLPAAVKQDDVDEEESDKIEQNTAAGYDISSLIEITKSHLPSIDDNISALVKDTETAKFKEIEAQREQAVQQAAVLDALQDLADGDNTLIGGVPGAGAAARGGQNGEDGDGYGWFDSLRDNILSAGLMFKMFGKVLGRLFIPLGIALTALDFAIGAFKGWGEAADKLGKKAEDVTFMDKIASAIGGGMGQLASLVDSVLGIFGLDSKIADFVDKTTTEFLANFFQRVTDTVTKLYNFFANIFDIAFPEGFSIGALLEAPVLLTKEWLNTLFSIVFPEMEFKLSDLIVIAYDKIKEWFSDLLKFDFLDFDYKGMADSAIQATKDKISNIPGLDYFKEKTAKAGAVISDTAERAKEIVGIKSDKSKTVIPQTEPVFTPRMTSTSDSVEYPEQEGTVFNKAPKRKGVFASTSADIGGGEFPRPLDIEGKQDDSSKYLTTDQADHRGNATNMLIDDSINKEKNKQKQSAAIINAPKTNSYTNNNSSTANITSGINPRETDTTIRMMQQQYSF